MNKIFSTLRYGSAIFMYISSAFLVTNIFLSVCSDIYAVLSFLISTVIIFTAVFIFRTEMTKSEMAEEIHAFFIIAAVICGISYELSKILIVFRASSDNATTVLGMYIFSFVIIFSAFLCSLNGGDALIKLSNIVFIIPLIAFFISVFGFFTSGITYDILKIASPQITKSVLDGAISAFLLLSDIYIIIYMLKKENCYNPAISKNVFIFSVAFVLLFALIYRMMFGIEISHKLYVPAISAAGLIEGFDFEEVYLFAYSICLLFRASCRINILSDMMNKLVNKKSARSAIISILLIITSIASAYIANINIHGNVSETFAAVLFFISFIVFPLFGQKNIKNEL